MSRRTGPAILVGAVILSLKRVVPNVEPSISAAMFTDPNSTPWKTPNDPFQL